MDPDRALDDGRRAMAAWEDAGSPGDEHDAARDMSEAFGALDDWLSHGGFLPERWASRPQQPPQPGSAYALMREMLAGFEQAMRDEGIPGVHRVRVMNRLTWGDPAGYQRERPADDPDATQAMVPLKLDCRHGGEVHDASCFKGVLPATIPVTGPGGEQVGEAALTAVEDGVLASMSFAIPQHATEPSPSAIMFGADSREIDPADENDQSRHPLISTCACGAPVTRLAPDGEWQHCG